VSGSRSAYVGAGAEPRIKIRGCCLLAAAAYASFVIAMTIPISTNTTIAPCSQIQVGDIAGTA
jgi:hypothetical protein